MASELSDIQTLSNRKADRKAATGTSPNAVGVHGGHLSHMRTPAPPTGEQNNVFVVFFFNTYGKTKLFKWTNEDDNDLCLQWIKKNNNNNNRFRSLLTTV